MSNVGNTDQFYTLVNIIAQLRGPDGCPWDKQQSHKSLRDSLLEECYEVLEALDEDESRRLSEELGDLLMQVVFHAQVASEAGEFDLKEVIESINTKLIRRHPHVFGSIDVSGAEEVLFNWEKLKKKEKQKVVSMLDGVPKTMPALAYSQEIQGRVARVGFDWQQDAGVIDKLAEEISELSEARTKMRREEEFGDLLFTIANIARRWGIDLESALRRANKRFYGRFTRMEEMCQQRGLDLADLTFDEQNKLWEEVKRDK
ncbi:MAG: nucleoside triphosphate pyrophosphohydrolase [Dehalococcoidia bacterium]|nr:MAG: nucleoside triphosphate pyrophosphohydrolase [Dehalococcoidia bacterium]